MPDLYYLPGSSPCRAVQMVAAALDVPLNLKYLNLMAGEHRKPEYLKLNPQGSIPTLVDGETVVHESRAILMYLCDRYSREDSWYPRDVLRRTSVNQRLFFDACVLYPRFTEFFHPQVFGNAAPDPKKREAFERSVGLLNTFLADSTECFVAGPRMTIADISIFATLTTASELSFDLREFTNVQRWYTGMMERCPGAAANVAGAKEFRTYK
ncbi:glutathione S-transferase 2-like [Anopheles cruzii]|uniref:glutathione S-transferase 2-like n=1 Tax=Anopheles cruzii TaxID=68878 RepID=UPI0022EC3BF5|nr:glutathione S-transferase 2-like [Anopheles cruzii]